MNIDANPIAYMSPGIASPFLYSRCGLKACQKGINLVELMVGLALSLFLLLGLFSIFDTTRQTYSAQIGLAQVQEKQRLSITSISGVVQTSGYFSVSSRLVNGSDRDKVRAFAFPSVENAYAAGDTIFGTEGASGAADSLRIRFKTSSGDNVPNCQGNTNTSGAELLYDNQFSISANNELTCAVGTDGGALGSAIVLIEGVSNFQVSYGIDNTGLGSVTQYVSADRVTDWKKVHSVKLVLTYVNPNANLAGQPAVVTSTQVIQLMGNS